MDVGSEVRTREIIVADINVSVKALPPNQSLAGARYQREGYAEKVLMGTYRDPEGERIHFREIVQFCHLVGPQSDGGYEIRQVDLLGLHSLMHQRLESSLPLQSQ